jgi:hypothetical protein
MEESGYPPRHGWGVLGIIGREGGIVTERESWDSLGSAIFFCTLDVVWEWICGRTIWWGGYKLKLGQDETRKNLDFEVGSEEGWVEDEPHGDER